MSESLPLLFFVYLLVLMITLMATRRYLWRAIPVRLLILTLLEIAWLDIGVLSSYLHISSIYVLSRSFNRATAAISYKERDWSVMVRSLLYHGFRL
jgi:hypothetical protein